MVVERLKRAIVAAVNAPTTGAAAEAFGLVPTGTSATELAKIQQADSELGPP